MHSKVGQFSNRKRSPKRDNVIYFSILALLAMVSGAFPFYVHLHPDKFGPPRMTFYGSEGNGELLQQNAPEYQRNLVAKVKPRLELDRITTASIRLNKATDKAERLKSQPRQPFPEDGKLAGPEIQILFVTSERLLAVENGRIASFRIGSQLADGNVVTKIKQQGGSWVVETSGGNAMTWAASR